MLSKYLPSTCMRQNRDPGSSPPSARGTDPPPPMERASSYLCTHPQGTSGGHGREAGTESASKAWKILAFSLTKVNQVDSSLLKGLWVKNGGEEGPVDEVTYVKLLGY